MITVFVSKEGYYLNGEGVEAALRCSPALDDQGNPIFHELHHTYKVLYMALQAVAGKQKIEGDVIVYNDSRIVDELNGNTSFLDEVCERWGRGIRREVLPRIKSIVTFRKKPHAFVVKQIMLGEGMMTDSDQLMKIATQIEDAKKQQGRNMKSRVLEKFKRMWKNGQ